MKPVKLLLILNLLIIPYAGATSLLPVTSDELVQQAGLIIEGTVVDISYRNSDIESSDQVSLPHTFVTFRIEKTFKGNNPGQMFTIRFQGGADLKGRFLHVAGTPRFQLGDRNILFIRGNGTTICPLVGWYQGKYSVRQDKIVEPNGRTIKAGEFRDLLDRKVAQFRFVQSASASERSVSMMERIHVAKMKAQRPPSNK